MDRTALRAPMSLEKMTYDAATGSVIYRSKMHASLKRNFQVMSGAEWLELLCRHIPDRYEHLVRYAGWYSNRASGERVKKASPGAAPPAPSEEPMTDCAARAKAVWAQADSQGVRGGSLGVPQVQGADVRHCA